MKKELKELKEKIEMLEAEYGITAIKEGFKEKILELFEQIKYKKT